MIFLFQGDKARGRLARADMALLAAVEKFKTDKKVLVMSFKNYLPGSNLEDFMEEDTSIDTNGNPIGLQDSAFADDGIDALLRRAESGMLKKDNFDHCVTPLQKVYHGLDVLHTTKEPGFEKTLTGRWSHIEKILNIAESLYDYIFVYASLDNGPFLEKLNDMATKIVMVVRQGKKLDEPLFNQKVHNKIAILIADYEAESAWDKNKFKKMYNSNNIFTFPHNVEFGDAKEMGKTLWFAATNINPGKNDSNYNLITDAKKLVSWLDGSSQETSIHMADMPEFTTLERYERTPKLEFHPTDVNTETVETKGNFFKKGEQYTANTFTGRTTHHDESEFGNDDLGNMPSHLDNLQKEMDEEDTGFGTDGTSSPYGDIENLNDDFGDTEDETPAEDTSIHKDDSGLDTSWMDGFGNDGESNESETDDFGDPYSSEEDKPNFDDAEKVEEPEEPKIKEFSTDAMFEIGTSPN